MIDRRVQPIAAAVVLVSLLLLALMAGCDSSPPTAEDKKRSEESERERKAESLSEQAVRRYIKFPLDADFGWFNTDAREGSKAGLWVVEGQVKAKNLLGATLTHPWATAVSFRELEAGEVIFVMIDDKVMYTDVSSIEHSYGEYSDTGPGTSPETAKVINTPAGDAYYARQEAQAEERRVKEAIQKADALPHIIAKKNRLKASRKADEARRKVDGERRLRALHAEAAREEQSQAALSVLKIAKRFTTQGKTGLAKKWCQKVIDQYPHTKAAKEAGELLATLQAEDGA